MLQIKEISKEYRTESLVQKALDGVSLNLRDNEFVAILGPSGSGKTTLLNIIGGLDRYDQGDLIINGISTKQYKDRDWDSYRNHTIGFVFQSYNLIPHQTILANVELALTISGISKSERKQKAKAALDSVGLGGQYHKKPSQLSGGQMQRVAIARALVNNPKILLADEPTGALDSDTSLQVMDLLQEVAKDRLVVMVTHNPELAEAYATRIVNLKDGHIISDSHPLTIDETTLESPKYENMGKTSMSWLTSLSLSFNNLKTKKGRTLLTSFAGSIGIIGIALILSLSNGVNSYIQNIEEETLSEYPVMIQSTGFDMTSMMMESPVQKEKEENEIGTIEMVTNMFSKIGSNDLASLKIYLEGPQSQVDLYANALEYTYQVTPRIFMTHQGQVRQVNPDTSLSALGISSTASANSMMSTMMSTNVFFPLPQDADLYQDQYEVKVGHWPQNKNECILVLTPNGNISDFMLYTLGLRNPEELDQMVQDFAAEKEVIIKENDATYTYDDVLGITFKLVNASDLYVYDEQYQLYRDKTDDKEYIQTLVDNGEDLKIVGIVQAKEDITAAMLMSGIYYPASLSRHVIEQAQNSTIVKDQLAHPEINVFTGQKFGDASSQNAFAMESLFSINADLLQSAFSVDESAIQLDLSGLNEAFENASLPPIDLKEILSQIDFTVDTKEMQALLNDLKDGYELYLQNHPEANYQLLYQQLMAYLQSPEVKEFVQTELTRIFKENEDSQTILSELEALLTTVFENYLAYAKENGLVDPTLICDHFLGYVKSETVQQIIATHLSNMITNSGLEAQVTKIMENYLHSLSIPLQEAMMASMADLGPQIAKAIHFDADLFASAIEMNMTEEDLVELMKSMMNKDYASYDNNLRQLNYADFAKPASISIYPKNFESKASIIQILDDYNRSMEMSGNKNKVITYTDVVGTLMTSVTDIINVISYVLVAFIAISLIVSSIMIGVITYISVLERKKEIGILRAIGASKRNISQVFNAETLIIGLCSGMIGIGITVLLLIPINQIIHHIAGNQIIKAMLPWQAGIILILLSTVLTLIGGIIPSKKAAKEDPVMALRNE